MMLAQIQSAAETGLIDKLLDEDTIVFVVGGTIAIVAIVFATVTGMAKSLGRERTRREIAAYIAEGSMTPDQGERILRAKEPED